MLILKEKPSLIDFQNYVRDLEIERGFTEDTRLHKCLMIGEELGELCEEIREPVCSRSVPGIASELTDVFCFLLAIANRLEGIDLEAAIQKALKVEVSFHEMHFSELQRLGVLADESASDLCLRLVENVGQLFKFIRKVENLKMDRSSKLIDVNEKFADIIWILFLIANYFDFNIEAAFREKEEINKKRTWISSERSRG